ncbi:MAG: cobyrinate a,c-diamide synthase [Magnetococcales bacterium]|nr:cobyrinate a,c-diamide synthase [Magnetococcales bacterium]
MPQKTENQPSTPAGFIIAGLQSRSGKTTLTLALMAALKKAGVSIAPFKAGPDYIDPAWHQAICGRPSYNLDTFMVGSDSCRDLFDQQRHGAIGVVEGVMGLFDGKSGVGGPGSTADLAKTLGLPVILVVNARGMAGSIVPLIDGFTRAAKGFSIAGVIANMVGSTYHAKLLGDLLSANQLPPLLAWLPRQDDLILEERHLGLLFPEEHPDPPWERLASALQINIPELLTAAAKGNRKKPSQHKDTLESPKLLAGRQIAIARDHAFRFIYPANLEWLRNSGADLNFFSPLAGEPLPKNSQAIWFPGGYPELFCQELSESQSWHSIRQFALQGGPILAECGGMMALGESLTGQDGKTWPMAGLLKIQTTMTQKLAGLGYRQELSGVRGHEFHHSKRGPTNLPQAFNLEKGDSGIHHLNIRASYVHWYFPSKPEICAGWFS